MITMGSGTQRLNVTQPAIHYALKRLNITFKNSILP